MKGKRILLGITGGIAAYKIAFLIRLLKKQGADVKCILTPASSDFISPLTVATLSENPAYIDFWNIKDGVWTNHVELGMWPDVFLIAPLTANTLSKLANGYCDNLLTATYLSAKCPVIVSPAMDLDMYAHETTRQNLIKLASFGVNILPAEEGELASGLVGKGRMVEPETMVAYLNHFFETQTQFLNKQILITAGPTYEYIDPVRFIGNFSSGKMGYEIAKECLNRGAKVTLVSGPTNEVLTHPNLKLINVTTSLEMLEKVQENWKTSDVGIFSAAVADYRPEIKEATKIKKKEAELTIRLVKNPDILAWAGQNKSINQKLIGFALETNDAIEYGRSKLKAKNLDAIVINSLADKGAGFGGDTNKISILDNQESLLDFSVKTKAEVAIDIIDFIANKLS
jgi:phosphopantothenoylcysteine decarboxylase/phosphopantothenate--cysteine ligase